jgi:hypothetical protein
LGWRPGHRLDAAVIVDAVVFGSSATGRQIVESRGELAVPAAARSLAGLEDGSAVVRVAVVDQDLLVVHSHAAVVRLVAGHYADQAAEQGDIP